jgi:hypothetical protein
VDDTTGASSTCKCVGFGNSSLDGGGDFDPTNNSDLSNCIANSAKAVASAHTGAYNNVFIKYLDGSGQDSFYIEKDITDSTICRIKVGGTGESLVFGSDLTFQGSTVNSVVVLASEGIVIRARSTFENMKFSQLYADTNLSFLRDSNDVGGTVTFTNVQINFLWYVDSCLVDSGVTVLVDALSHVASQSIIEGSNQCPAFFDTGP